MSTLIQGYKNIQILFEIWDGKSGGPKLELRMQNLNMERPRQPTFMQQRKYMNVPGKENWHLNIILRVHIMA